MKIISLIQAPITLSPIFNKILKINTKILNSYYFLKVNYYIWGNINYLIKLIIQIIKIIEQNRFKKHQFLNKKGFKISNLLKK